MGGRKPAAAPAPGAFGESFLIHMVRDFALLLILVASLELAIRFASALCHFRTEGQAETEATAERAPPPAFCRRCRRGTAGAVVRRTVGLSRNG